MRSLIEHFHREVTTHGFDVAVASSGTAETVARIAHAVTGAEPLRTYNCFEVSRPALDDVVARLVKHKSAAGRRKVPGLEAHRADIIVAGSLILATIAEAFDVDSFLFSESALREGVLLDTISRRRGGGAEMHHLRDVSRRSIERLVQRCDDDPAHSIHVAKLAVALFDAIPELQALGSSAREYLEAGALLANVGLVVAHSQHHLHAYYVIRNSELAGLTDNEIEVIAQVARYHRKSEPKQSHQPFAALPESDQRLVRALAAVLRVAIGLDRRHEGRVCRCAHSSGRRRSAGDHRTRSGRRRHRSGSVRRGRTVGVARAGPRTQRRGGRRLNRCYRRRVPPSTSSPTGRSPWAVETSWWSPAGSGPVSGRPSAVTSGPGSPAQRPSTPSWSAVRWSWSSSWCTSDRRG